MFFMTASIVMKKKMSKWRKSVNGAWYIYKVRGWKTIIGMHLDGIRSISYGFEVDSENLIPCEDEESGLHNNKRYVFAQRLVLPHYINNLDKDETII